MAAPFAQLTIGTPGVGGAHASYITRMSALDPNKPIDPANDQHPTRLQELDQDDSTVQQTLAENLDVHSLDSPTTPEHSEPDADPVWTWNAPQYLTDDNYGILQLSHSDGTCDCLSPNPQAQAREPISQFLRPWAPPDVKEHDRKLFQALVFDKPLSNIYSDDRRLRLKEKADNLRTYFGSKEEFEKAKGGRTHYKVKLSFEVPATNQQIRELTNESLQQTFPRSIAFAAIHRDTDHPHVHLYLHSRQIDGKRIQLKNNDYRSVDEKWARLYSDFAGDRSIYVEHLRKKEETREWKIAAAEAYQKGQLVPPKPERDSDRREKLAERRLSAQRSKARDQGQKLEPRPQAEPVIRPSSEKETGRLLAKHEVAQERLAHLIRTEALQTQIYWAGRNAHDIAVTLDKTLSARKEMGKAKLPAVVYTIDEVKELQEYTKSRDLPVTDDHAGRLQATQVVSAAELKDAQSKAEAFQASRHFWKLDVPGWEKGLTLKEVEDRIKFHNDQRFRLYNFLRPTRRESIQNAIDYFQETKKDMQNQLAAKELPIQKNLSTAQLKYDTVSKLIENAEKARFPQSRSMPRPLFYRPDLVTLHEIAHRNKDAELLGYLYGQVKDKVLANPSPETLSRLKGNAVIARIEMLKEADRLKAAVEFREFRRLPLKDAQGRDYTRSLREVQPKTALELIVRHFTDTGEQKKEGKALAEASARQLERAEAQYNKAREWSLATDKIAHDHYRAARVSEKQIAPRLSPEQIVQVKQYGGTLPLLSQVRRQFKEDARMAERRFQQMELALGSGPAQQTKSPEPTPSTAEQSPMEIITNTSVRTRQYPQLGATQLNDHQIRDANPATDAQRTNTPPVHAEPHGRSLSLSAATTPTPDLFRRDPQQFAKAIEIANTNKDAKLLSQLYDIAKDKLLKRVSPESLSYLKGQAILGRMEMAQRADSLAEAYQQHRVVPPPHDAPNRLANLPAEVKIAEQEHSKARDWSLIRDRIAADRFKAAGVVESQVVPDLDRQQITQLREFANTLPELSMFRKEFTEAAIIAEQALLQREAAQSAKRESQIARPQDHATRDRESSPPNLRSTHDRDR